MLNHVSLDAVFAKLMAHAAHRMIEPLALYEPVTDARCDVLISGGGIAAPSIPALRGDRNAIFCGFDCAADRLRLKIYGSENIVFVGAHCRVGGDIEIKGNGNVVYIGAFTTISSITHNQTGNNGLFMIGDNCMLSSRIQVGNTDGHGIYDLESGDRINPDRDVFIDDRVWIARDVSISKGAVINSDVIVGQKAHVSGVLEAKSVYAGVPARQLRKNVTWARSAENSLDEQASGTHAQRHQVLLHALKARIGEAISAPTLG